MAPRRIAVLLAIGLAVVVPASGILAVTSVGLASHPLQAQSSGPADLGSALSGAPHSNPSSTASTAAAAPSSPTAAATPSAAIGSGAPGAIPSSVLASALTSLDSTSPAAGSSAPGGSFVNGDYSAVAPSGTTIGNATGTFPASLGLTGEYNQNASACSTDPENGCYSLQINSNLFPFVSTPFTGTSDFGSSWEQFVYYNDPTGSSGVLWIWYVLIGSIPSKNGCNGTVAMDGITWEVTPTQPSNCYGHTPGLNVPSSFLTAPLTTLEFYATADYEGSTNDTLQLCSNAGLGCSSTVVAPDGIADLAPSWTYAEFNVFGDGGGSEAIFTGQGTLNVSTAIASPSGVPLTPSCTSYSQTGETNNLFLGPCQTSGSAITFTESTETFNIFAEPSDLTVLRGGTVSFTIDVVLLGGSAAPVTVSVLSGVPGGASASLSSSTVTPNGTTTLQISTSPSTALGDFTLIFQGTFYGLAIANTTHVHVYDFTVDLAPSSQTIVRGLSAVYSLNLTLVPGSSTVGIPAALLSDLGIPGDATATFSAVSIVPTLTGCTISTLEDCQSLTVQTRGPPSGSLGDFTPVVTANVPGGAGGSRSASVGLHLFDFSVALVPNALTLAQGSSAVITVNVGLVPGSSTVGVPSAALSLAGVPTGMTATGFPSSTAIPSTFSFTLATAGSGGYVSCPQVHGPWPQDLQRADLAHCDLAGASLRGDNLQQANLTDADLAGASLVGANLKDANLAGADTVGTDFFGANLEGADLSGVGALGSFTLTVTGTTENVSRVGTASLTVLGDQLSGDNLQLTNLFRANLTLDDVVGASLQFSNLASVVAPGANFSNANLEWSILAGIYAPGSNFSAANLTSDDLTGADLAGAYLAHADLRWANLPFADLEAADLQGADLRMASLFDANLEDANLENSNLEGAFLRGANLTGANLTGANTKGAVFVIASSNSERSIFTSLGGWEFPSWALAFLGLGILGVLLGVTTARRSARRNAGKPKPHAGPPSRRLPPPGGSTVPSLPRLAPPPVPRPRVAPAPARPPEIRPAHLPRSAPTSGKTPAPTMVWLLEPIGKVDLKDPSRRRGGPSNVGVRSARPSTSPVRGGPR